MSIAETVTPQEAGPEAGLRTLHGLLARNGSEPPSAAGTDEALDKVWTRYPLALAAAVTEQVCGVLPLLDSFDGTDSSGLIQRIRAGRITAALGLFTPNAHFALPVPSVRAVEEGGRLVLDGRYRYAYERADVSLVAVGLSGEVRLVLLRHDADAVRPRGSGRTTGGGWAELDGVVIEPSALSRPVSWAPDGTLSAVLDDYAWAFSRRAISRPARVLAELRRVLATTGEGIEALSTSQYLAHELSRLEIEVSLTSAAARLGPEFRGDGPGGQSAFSVLLSCVDLLRRVAAVAADMTTELGLRGDPTQALAGSVDILQAYFGGRRMVENELARRMGLASEAPEAVRE